MLLLSGEDCAVAGAGRTAPLLPMKERSIGEEPRDIRDQLLPSSSLKARMWKIVLSLVLVNALMLTTLLVLSHAYPALFSAGLLALSFGLRHAVDADHIAAIDNVTRRLIAEGKQPLLVGLWFSLGHSGVVCIICVATACGAEYLQNSGLFEGVGAMVSTAVSASVLFLIGTANLVALLSSRKHTSDGGHSHAHAQGVIARCCPTVLGLVDAEWKMFGLGFFFGLGFETSSEVALLALAAMSPGQGIPPLATLLLPLLFAGGMSLIDTLDGLLMSWAYGYATTTSGRVDYNSFLTVASSMIAIAVGGVELLGCIQSQLKLGGPFWSVVESINDNVSLPAGCTFERRRRTRSRVTRFLLQPQK